MLTSETESKQTFSWEPQPAAARFVDRQLEFTRSVNATIDNLAQRMLGETGTRLIDWVDHLVVPADSESASQLADVGYQKQATGTEQAVRWQHPDALLPSILVQEGATHTVAISVDDAALFVEVHASDGAINGDEGEQLRTALISTEGDVELLVVERHGWPEMSAPDNDSTQIAAAQQHLAKFNKRSRPFAAREQGFADTVALFRTAEKQIGTDWACDLFFTTERIYWQSRNHAARVQFARQEQLGLGWANHDHHTYRSSRRCFALLIESLELMGFRCRERFYAGREAGWGAQVLEHPATGVVIFADVDLAPEEVQGDFAHEPLTERDELGTVGLWCELHGESFLAAGMHHLECQFDFDAARGQLAAAGVPTMAPFTDFPYLKQAFTQGETWQVDPAAIEDLLSKTLINAQEAERFRTQGVVGSHLEILQRNDGYKGFNQTGINDIIRRTDPREN